MALSQMWILSPLLVQIDSQQLHQDEKISTALHCVWEEKPEGEEIRRSQEKNDSPEDMKDMKLELPPFEVPQDASAQGIGFHF